MLLKFYKHIFPLNFFKMQKKELLKSSFFSVNYLIKLFHYYILPITFQKSALVLFLGNSENGISEK